MAVIAQDIILQPLQPGHLPGALALSQAEGWPHRIEEWQIGEQLGQGLVALLGDRVVGTAMLTPYGEDAATCSMIIVDASMRGHGLGRRLMSALLDLAGPRECRLVATVAGLPLYEKMGFVATGTIRQFQGFAQTVAAPDSAALRRATGADLPAICDLDRAAIGMARNELLARLYEEGPITMSEDGSGYLAVRHFGRGRLIGPLVARCDETAGRLLQAALAGHAGGFVRLDLSAAAAGLAGIVRAAGLKHVGGGVVMTRPGLRRASRDGTASVYALASQAQC